MSDSATSAGPRPLPDADVLDDNYRAISRLAITGLVCGLLSPLVMVFPLLLPIAAVGAISSLLAIRAVNRNPQSLSGAKIAYVGLALSTVFGCWLPTHGYFRQQFLFAQAKQIADEWFEVVRDKRPMEAHQLYHHMAPPGSDLKRFYEDRKEAKTDLDQFVSSPPIKQMLASERATSSLTFREKVRLQREHSNDYMTLDYRFAYEEQGIPQSIDIRIIIGRALDDDGGAEWYIYDVTLPR